MYQIIEENEDEAKERKNLQTKKSRIVELDRRRKVCNIYEVAQTDFSR